MPHLRVETNVKSSDINLDEALKELSATIAATTGKKNSNYMIIPFFSVFWSRDTTVNVLHFKYCLLRVK